MTIASAPGKAFIAGEYAVLMPNTPALVLAVNRRVTVEAIPADHWSIDTGAVQWREGEPVPIDVLFVKAVIDRNFAGTSPRAIRTHDDLHDGELKLGLGGSAAVTVATTLALSGENLSRAGLWMFADETHRWVQEGRGSGGDVAASVFGGVIRYTTAERADKPVVIHPDVRFILAWSGSIQRTSPRLLTWAEFARSRKERAALFGKLSTEAVNAIERGIGAGDIDLLRGGVGQARAALRGLEADLGISIETDRLRAACDSVWKAGAAGKISGAGGGDCAIVLAIGDERATAAARAIESVGLRAIPVTPGEAAHIHSA